MHLPAVHFQIWKLMAAIAVGAGLMAEVRDRPARFTRLSMMHYERASACLDRAGRVCRFGETPASIDAFYRRPGPAAWLDSRTAQYHFDLAWKSAGAVERPWLPLLPDPPPPGNPGDMGAVPDWAKETVAAPATLIVAFALLPTCGFMTKVRCRAGVRRSAVPPPG